MASDGASGADVTLGPPALFTSGADTVDFNSLTPSQDDAIADGADVYNGLGGGDVVALPSVVNYNESVGSGKTLGWTNTSQSTFDTDSQPGDTYTISGTDGDYFIDEGAGTEFVTIDGNGKQTQSMRARAKTRSRSPATSRNTIEGGSGADAVTITGDGANQIDAGSGRETVTINGDGADLVEIGDGDDIVDVTEASHTTVECRRRNERRRDHEL